MYFQKKLSQISTIEEKRSKEVFQGNIKRSKIKSLKLDTILSQTILNQLNKGTIKLNDLQLRLWNEGATLLLISIISLAVLKTSISWLKAIFVFLLIGITLMFLINLYKRLLNK